ncbi:hypothetical protein [Mameliella sediminis]|uniref:hypothetical protein n=1 Tax=Mameliella sediminis TaxID=2836866 RepID=UPI001C45F0AC|nr:hypothetical protein [Mameliella sediminis]MBV7394109.1 hypothetical protein [Mameliella sediminis]
MPKTSAFKREAIELWSQMLDRAKNNEWSTFDDPDYVHPGRDAASNRQALSDAGWSDDEIDSREQIHKTLSDEAPTTSPGVARFTEAALQRLSQPIENAAAQLNLANRDKVHFAIEPKAGPFLSKVNVVMTDQSIITMGSFFTRYCGLVSRAYIRTVLLAPTSVGIDFDENLLRKELRKRPDLIFYWWRIFFSFALTGTHILAPYKPSTKVEILQMEHVAFSMEIFGLSHEYAHHALNHGRTVGPMGDAHREEFEADAFALRICKIVEADDRYSWVKGQPVPNPYLQTGAGGILLLSSLEIFRKVKDKIFGQKAFDTHPDFLDRSVKIKNTYVMQPNLYAASQDFCAAVENVLRCVMLELEPLMAKLSPRILDELALDDWEAKSFE